MCRLFCGRFHVLGDAAEGALHAFRRKRTTMPEAIPDSPPATMLAWPANCDIAASPSLTAHNPTAHMHFNRPSRL